MPGSAKPTVSLEMAKTILHWHWDTSDLDAKVLKGIDQSTAPRLRYMWAPSMHKQEEEGRGEVYAPTWEMIPGDEMMVDAQIGRYWRNC